jgi:hypothetical protein
LRAPRRRRILALGGGVEFVFGRLAFGERVPAAHDRRDGRDPILGATYVGAVYVWGGEDKRYRLLFADDLSKATLVATNGHGSLDAKCHRIIQD